jgi:hypothetical protein
LINLVLINLGNYLFNKLISSELFLRSWVSLLLPFILYLGLHASCDQFIYFSFFVAVFPRMWSFWFLFWAFPWFLDEPMRNPMMYCIFWQIRNTFFLCLTIMYVSKQPTDLHLCENFHYSLCLFCFFSFLQFCWCDSVFFLPSWTVQHNFSIIKSNDRYIPTSDSTKIVIIWKI